MSGLDAIVFDLGNVLLRVNEAFAAQRFAARTGQTRGEVETYFRTTPYATELALGRLSRQQFYRAVSRDLRFHGAYDEFARIWSEIFEPIEPMVALAEALRARLPRLILSNTNAIHIEYILEHYPFVHDFDAHIFSHEVGHLKPDAAIYEWTIKKYGLTAGRAVLIDDLAANVDGARRAGWQAILYQDAEQVRAELTKLGVVPI
jgi:putative hydrolase of the HAD superfamily